MQLPYHAGLAPCSILVHFAVLHLHGILGQSGARTSCRLAFIVVMEAWSVDIFSSTDSHSGMPALIGPAEVACSLLLCVAPPVPHGAFQKLDPCMAARAVRSHLETIWAAHCDAVHTVRSSLRGRA